MRYMLILAALVACGKVNPKQMPDAPTVDAPGSGALTLAKSSSWVRQSGTYALAFTITRDASITGALTVHVGSLPTGVTAADVAVAAGATTGTITFAADTTAT